MTYSDIRGRIIGGKYTQSDIYLIERAIRENDSDKLDDLLYPYIKYVKLINEDIVLDFCFQCRDSFTVSEAIKGLTYRKFKSQKFEDLLYQYSRPQDWDFGYELLITVVICFPRVVPLDEKVIETLKACYAVDDPLVRDSVVEAVQVYLGIPDADVVRGNGKGNLAEHVSSAVYDWLAEKLS